MAAHRYVSNDALVGASSIVAGQIAFGNGSSIVGDSNLVWDNTNKRLGVGKSSPNFPIDVQAALTPAICVGNASSEDGRLYFGNSNHGVKRGSSVSVTNAGVNTIEAFTAGASLSYVWSHGGTALAWMTSDGKYHATGGVYGGESSGGNLTLGSTTHATKGKVYFGAALTSAFDEVNNRLGINTASPGTALEVKRTTSSSDAFAFGVSDACRLGIYSNTSNPEMFFYDLGSRTGSLLLDRTNGLFTMNTVGAVDLSFAVASAEKLRITSGGLFGGATSGGNLTLGSTTHATKGKINFGSAGLTFWDEANSRLMMGLNTPGHSICFYNTSYRIGAAAGLEIDSYDYVNLMVGSASKVQVDSNGGIKPVAGALATNATDGFLYIRGNTGAPTGAPTAVTGAYAVYVDATNNRLYVRIGGTWRYATLT